MLFVEGACRVACRHRPLRVATHLWAVNRVAGHGHRTSSSDTVEEHLHRTRSQDVVIGHGGRSCSPKKQSEKRRSHGEARVWGSQGRLATPRELHNPWCGTGTTFNDRRSILSASEAVACFCGGFTGPLQSVAERKKIGFSFVSTATALQPWKDRGQGIPHRGRR